MLNAFIDPLCSKFCWHNRRVLEMPMRIDKNQMSEIEDVNYTHSDLEIKEGSIPDSPVILLNSKWLNATETR